MSLAMRHVMITVAGVAVVTVFLLRRRQRGLGSGRTEPWLSDPSTQVAAGQQHHPSALRNRIPILKAMLRLLPDSDTFKGRALEIATGTGGLMEVIAPAYPHLTYQPSEYVPTIPATPAEQWNKHGKIGLRHGLDELANIDEHGVKIFSNCLPAIALDLLQWTPASEALPPRSLALILVTNVLHITPWACSVNLFRGAGVALQPGGYLVVYGPFKLGGHFVGNDGGAGNAKFDAKLRSTNDAWAIRDVEELCGLATDAGLKLHGQTDMPANNLTLCFVREH